MTATERKNMIDRMVSMEGIINRIKDRLKKPELDDPEMTEYELNRLKTAIYNFKKVQLPKILKNEKAGSNSNAGNTKQSTHKKPKTKTVHR